MRDLEDLRPGDAVGALVVTGRSDPRVLQVAFTVFVAADFAVRSAGRDDLQLSGWPGLGLLLTLLTTALAFGVPWDRLRPGAVTVLPVLDIAAIGAVRISPDGSAAGILVVVPALWLGRELGRRAALVVLLAVALLTVLPSMLVLGADALSVSRAFLITVVAAWSALAIAYGLERIRSERDEAERRGAELAAALTEIERHQRSAQAIFDTVDVGLVLLGRDGRDRDHNQRLDELMRLGFPDGYEEGQTGLVHAADGTTRLREEELPTARAARGEEFEDLRIWVGSDPLTRRALSVSARSVRGPDGRLAGAALAYKDVTDLMRAVAIKDDFVAMVSHELRTPLTSIAGYVEMLQDRTDLPGDVPPQLEVVERNSRRLLGLISDLLHSAQQAAGPVPLARRSCDLVSVVRDAVEAAGPAARAAGLELVVVLPDGLEADVDPMRIGQVVDNLLSNAVKYTGPGGTVTVRLGTDAAGAVLEVTDTGVGISAADRDRLFTRFFRSRDAEDRSIQGVGLGLSISRGIVEAHGGRIEVDSQLGVGSTFRVRLPVAA